MNIIIRDDLPPESLAMLQALYSRSPASVLDHIKKVKAVGADKFMSTYYIGYGHRSIGDCGSTTLFIEDVSMLAAKAIQDWPLYRGQEASTRYMDFSTARIEDPVGSADSGPIQSAWMEFYHSAQGPLREHLLATYPKADGEQDDVYERAINARRFDVLRSFLPAGATTNLSWHTDLRQAQDHLDWLVHHPDPTIQILGTKLLDALLLKYKSSFDPGGRVDQDNWKRMVSRKFTYFDDEIHLVGPSPHKDVRLTTDMQEYYFSGIMPLLDSRPKRAELPHWMSRYGLLHSTFLLDFGSFRDLQRHRNGVVRMPLLSTRWDFHPWYLSQLPSELRERAESLIRLQKYRIKTLDLLGVPRVVQQYYIAMGFRVACEVTQGLPAFIYRVELRTSPSVHPTLRLVVQEEARQFAERFPKIKLYADMSADTWDIRRGRQTITEKTV